MRTITTHKESAFNTLSDIGAAGEKLKASIHNFRGIYLSAWTGMKTWCCRFAVRN